MRIALIPIDNRPVCYTLAQNIASIDESIDLILPPRELLGDLKKAADKNAILDWLKNLTDIDALIISLDTLTYGGLIPSRRGIDGKLETLDEIKSFAQEFKPLLKNKKVYAFSSIMRIPNNNYNDEEKEYWAKYGKKIFEYSYNTDKFGKTFESDIPSEILEDYLDTRKRNFEINKMYLNWQKEGLFETLIFSKDDCAEYGLNVQEAHELEKLGGTTKTGADEIPLSLLARAVKKDIKIYPIYTEPNYKNCISNYEDVSIEKSVIGQIELAGMEVAKNEKEADVILVVNNFINKQGEHVMGWETEPYHSDLKLPTKFYAIADVRYANGADNSFVEKLLPQIESDKFYGYSAWNTSANSLGSLLAGIKFKYNAQMYNDKAFRKLQTIRFLDDWAYQANVRSQITEPCQIKHLMKPFEDIVFCIFGKYKAIDYIYPWKRKFEIEVCL